MKKIPKSIRNIKQVNESMEWFGASAGDIEKDEGKPKYTNQDIKKMIESIKNNK